MNLKSSFGAVSISWVNYFVFVVALSSFLLQSLNSDQFWWASKVEVGGKEMYNPGFIEEILELYKKYAVVSENEELEGYIGDISNQIKSKI